MNHLKLILESLIEEMENIVPYPVLLKLVNFKNMKKYVNTVVRNIILQVSSVSTVLHIVNKGIIG